MDENMSEYSGRTNNINKCIDGKWMIEWMNMKKAFQKSNFMTIIEKKSKFSISPQKIQEIQLLIAQVS